MKWLGSRVLWGSLLLFCGVLILLQNLGVLPFGDLFWSIPLGLGGLFFISITFQNRASWWTLIPGITLLCVALVIILASLAPGFAATWSGSLVLGGIGLSFWVVYALERDQWWAVIPGGVMLTLAVVAGLGEIRPEMETGGIFFLGLGATFGVLSVMRTPVGQMKWAWIPAVILMIMGILMITAVENLIAYLLPAALVLLGGYLIWRTIRK
jgi:hypothetical protein